MSKTIDFDKADRETESLALEMDVTFNEADKILKTMDKELKEV